MKREEGYYWVKVFNDDDWEIAYYSHRGFLFVGDEEDYSEVEMFAIDEKQIVRLP